MREMGEAWFGKEQKNDSANFNELGEKQILNERKRGPEMGERGERGSSPK